MLTRFFFLGELKTEMTMKDKKIKAELHHSKKNGGFSTFYNKEY
jgi:hypothetical protein